MSDDSNDDVSLPPVAAPAASEQQLQLPDVTSRLRTLFTQELTGSSNMQQTASTPPPISMLHNSLPLLTPPLTDPLRPPSQGNTDPQDQLNSEPYLVIQPTSPDPSPSPHSKRRNTPRRYRQYTDQQLEEALQAVREGLNRSKAARMYGVPETTLRREEVRRQARQKKLDVLLKPATTGGGDS